MLWNTPLPRSGQMAHKGRFLKGELMTLGVSAQRSGGQFNLGFLTENKRRCAT